MLAMLPWLTGTSARTLAVTRIRNGSSGSSPTAATLPTATPPNRTRAPGSSPPTSVKWACTTWNFGSLSAQPRIVAMKPSRMSALTSTRAPALISVAVKWSRDSVISLDPQLEPISERAKAEALSPSESGRRARNCWM